MSKILDTIEIPEDLSNYVESLQYEVNARKDLLGFAMGKGLVGTEAFNTYHKEYKEFFVQYETAKQELYDKYVKDKWDGIDVTWHLYFSDHCIRIEEETFNEKSNKLC